MTELASDCIETVQRVLQERGTAAQFVEVVGETETYWKATLRQAGLDLYVYSDGAGVMDGREWIAFEWADYRDRDALCSAFAGAVASRLVREGSDDHRE